LPWRLHLSPRLALFSRQWHSAGADLALKTDQDRMCVPADGLTDLFARTYGDYLSEKLGQPVIVENRGSATGSVAALAAKQSAPDGNTLLVTINATFARNPVLYKNLAYDPDKDFVLISSMSPGHLLLMAAKATDAANLKEFVEFARKNETNVGTFGPGTTPTFSLPSSTSSSDCR
jgi:tripartite-type tricarboxylate transporter receptor subunit TctC